MGLGPLMAVSAGLQALQGVKSFQENRAMAQATKAETAANVFSQQEKFKVDKANLTRQQEQFAGKQTVSAAGSGATLGSFDSLFADTAQQSIMDQALLEYDSKLNIANTQYEGQMKKKQLYQRGRSSLISGVINGANTIGTNPAAMKSINKGINSQQGLARTFSSNPYGPQKLV